MTLPVEQRKEWIKSRRAQRKLTRRARLRRQFLRYLMLALLLLGGGAGFCYSQWSLTNIKTEVSVRGNKVLSSGQVISTLKGMLNEPVYKLDPKKLEDRIERLSVVKQAFVRRYAFPQPRLVVEVMEEFPWASFTTNENEEAASVICESGKVIKIADFPHVIQPPLKIYGPKYLRLTSDDVAQWASWVVLIEKQTKKPVNSVDLRDPLSVKIVDGDLLLKLGAPDSTLTKRLARLATVQTALRQSEKDSNIEYIDLGLDNNIPVKVAKRLEKPSKTLRSQL